MRTTIDRAGRIVVPKRLRDALGLTSGLEIEIHARDGKLEIEAVAADIRLQVESGHTVAVPSDHMPELAASLVRKTLEQTRP